MPRFEAGIEEIWVEIFEGLVVTERAGPSSRLSKFYQLLSLPPFFIYCSNPSYVPCSLAGRSKLFPICLRPRPPHYLYLEDPCTTAHRW